MSVGNAGRQTRQSSGMVSARQRRQASSSSLRRVAISSFQTVTQISGATRPCPVTRLSTSVGWPSWSKSVQHRHQDVRAGTDLLRHPAGEAVLHVGASVAQQPVHLLDRVLGHQPTNLRQRLADHRHRQRGARHHPERGAASAPTRLACRSGPYSPPMKPRASRKSPIARATSTTVHTHPSVTRTFCETWAKHDYN
jgi:hypothetical protein